MSELTLATGVSYLLLISHRRETHYILNDALGEGHRVLLISDHDPRKPTPSEDSQFDSIFVAPIASVEDLQMLHPTRLHELRALVAQFLGRNSQCTVILDCFENLVSRHGSALALRAIHDLSEEVALNGGNLLVAVNPNRLASTTFGLLKRELEELHVGGAMSRLLEVEP